MQNGLGILNRNRAFYHGVYTNQTGVIKECCDGGRRGLCVLPRLSKPIAGDGQRRVCIRSVPASDNWRCGLLYRDQIYAERKASELPGANYVWPHTGFATITGSNKPAAATYLTERRVRLTMSSGRWNGALESVGVIFDAGEACRILSYLMGGSCRMKMRTSLQWMVDSYTEPAYLRPCAPARAECLCSKPILTG